MREYLSIKAHKEEIQAIDEIKCHSQDKSGISYF